MTTLAIEGMSCGHCVKAVESALSTVDGVTQVVSVDLDTGKAEVAGEADSAALIAAIENEGYTASVV